MRRALVMTYTVLVGSAGAAPAQPSRSDPVDVQMWPSMALRADLPRGWAATAQYEARFVDDASRYRGSYLTGNVAWSPVRRFEAITGYRLTLRQTVRAHRYTLGGRLRWRPEYARLSLRALAQHQRTTEFDDESEETRAGTFVRTRLQAERRLTGRLDLFVSTEPVVDVEGGTALDSWRNTAGLTWAYARRRSVELYYSHRPDYAKSYDRLVHVIGMELGVTTQVRRAPAKRAR